MKKIVFATNNAHKLEEVRAILAGKVEILSLNDIGCHDEIPETADTLEENAAMKSRFIYEKYGFDCFADDTGLEVTALNMQPGVFSARYAGEPSNSERNMQKLLQELQGESNREARFRTIIALIFQGEYTYFEGIVEGEILLEKCGAAGFGYDPIFKPKGYNESFAEISADEKNKISHRGKAVRKFALHFM